MSKTKKYWTGLDQLHNTPEFQERAENEFAPEATAEHLLEGENLDEGSTKRRDFLKFLGFSVGAATLAACETPVTKSIPYLNKPEEVTPGIPNYYASTFFDGTDRCALGLPHQPSPGPRQCREAGRLDARGTGARGGQAHHDVAKPTHGARRGHDHRLCTDHAPSVSLDAAHGT